MNINSQSVWIYRGDLFAKKMMQKKSKFLQAIGGCVLNFIMAYSYALVVQLGEQEFKKGAAKKRNVNRNKNVSGMRKDNSGK